MELLRRPLRLFTCIPRKRVAPASSFETDNTGKQMEMSVPDIVDPSDDFDPWDLEPRSISLGDLNSIKWIQSRCTETFASIDKGGMVVFMYGLFAKSIDCLSLDIPLFVFIPSLSRQELGEAWAATTRRRNERETMEDHLYGRIERDVFICCADDPYSPCKKPDELRQGNIAVPDGNEGELIELYPKCPVIIDAPLWEDNLFEF